MGQRRYSRRCPRQRTWSWRCASGAWLCRKLPRKLPIPSADTQRPRFPDPLRLMRWDIQQGPQRQLRAMERQQQSPAPASIADDTGPKDKSSRVGVPSRSGAEGGTRRLPCAVPGGWKGQRPHCHEQYLYFHTQQQYKWHSKQTHKRRDSPSAPAAKGHPGHPRLRRPPRQLPAKSSAAGVHQGAPMARRRQGHTTGSPAKGAPAAASAPRAATRAAPGAGSGPAPAAGPAPVRRQTTGPVTSGGGACDE